MSTQIKGVFASLVNNNEELKSPYPYWLRPSISNRIKRIKKESGAKDYDTVFEAMCKLAEIDLKIKK